MKNRLLSISLAFLSLLSTCLALEPTSWVTKEEYSSFVKALKTISLQESAFLGELLSQKEERIPLALLSYEEALAYSKWKEAEGVDSDLEDAPGKRDLSLKSSQAHFFLITSNQRKVRKLSTFGEYENLGEDITGLLALSLLSRTPALEWEEAAVEEGERLSLEEASQEATRTSAFQYDEADISGGSARRERRSAISDGEGNKFINALNFTQTENNDLRDYKIFYNHFVDTRRKQPPRSAFALYGEGSDSITKSFLAKTPEEESAFKEDLVQKISNYDDLRELNEGNHRSAFKTERNLDSKTSSSLQVNTKRERSVVPQKKNLSNLIKRTLSDDSPHDFLDMLNHRNEGLKRPPLSPYPVQKMPIMTERFQVRRWQIRGIFSEMTSRDKWQELYQQSLHSFYEVTKDFPQRIKRITNYYSVENNDFESIPLYAYDDFVACAEIAEKEALKEKNIPSGAGHIVTKSSFWEVTGESLINYEQEWMPHLINSLDKNPYQYHVDMFMRSLIQSFGVDIAHLVMPENRRQFAVIHGLTNIIVKDVLSKARAEVNKKLLLPDNEERQISPNRGEQPSKSIDPEDWQHVEIICRDSNDRESHKDG